MKPAQRDRQLRPGRKGAVSGLRPDRPRIVHRVPPPGWQDTETELAAEAAENRGDWPAAEALWRKAAAEATDPAARAAHLQCAQEAAERVVAPARQTG